MFPDIAHHHGVDGLKNICDFLRGGLEFLDDEEFVVNSYSSILTGVDMMSASGVVTERLSRADKMAAAGVVTERLSRADKMAAAGVVTERLGIICDLCGKHFHARGMPMHKMACVKKHSPLQNGHFSQTHT